MQPSELIELIRTGESQEVEFKAQLLDERTIARNLSAFANSGGGTLVVGVDDRGVRGLNDRDSAVTASRIKTVADRLLSRSPTIEWVSLDGQNVVVVSIPGGDPSLGPAMTAEGGIFRREGVRVVPDSTQLRRVTPDPGSRRLRMFVAMSFHFEEEPALVDYFEAIKRALISSGVPVDLRRIDLVEGDYEIMQKTEEEIRLAEIVLTDYTLNSPNVYYEAGMAKALGKRLIRSARKGTILPFDVRQYRTISYVNATQLETQLGPAIVDAFGSTD